ncbi:MAG TPA: dicarboxylate/amino acid:cation symporter [Nitrosomonas nitrosa]|uniref:dicarboxylate/amino acid:cation symporter n=1 Tax=Nitrosomonas nitrosa TaxID=52442 RepID=UPI000D30FE1D|nr:dicarboxylate/amino acid:cation symporter [Nitrosomonas nitrosa]PTQ93712.1 Na+/H+-dicarboxylate symporter [Nitrosomonas nitrosa]HBZ29122.1 dicarboxylate/amino acid:cation symporter [Nitrosomonas nitrosa]HNP51932.1 dicarboxylate/amino acid:cation symporter [Nitrosomonas nitrosa]
MLKISLNTQILLGALIGILLGLGLATLDQESSLSQNSLYIAGLMSTLFIDLLKMVLVPLVFTSIVVGVANLRAHHQINRVWTTAISFFAGTMVLAILLALIVANLFRPGEGLEIAMFKDAMQSFEVRQMTLREFFAHFLHSLFLNPLAALAQGNIIAIVVFALLLGIALVVGGERYQNILVLMKEFLELILMLVGWIMRLAPFGIMALLLQLVVAQDMTLLTTLIKFILIVIGTTLVHGLILLPLILYLTTGMTPLRFWNGGREALITAFATSSSAATMPITMRCVEQHLHVKSDVAGFVIPLGATMNMDGTALYEAIAALFIANLVGIELDIMQQLIVFLTAMLAAIGAPGIPSAGMVTMVMVLQAVGLPAEAVAILLPIDRLLDAFRTMVNVEGDMIGSLVVQKWIKNT